MVTEQHYTTVGHKGGGREYVFAYICNTGGGEV